METTAVITSLTSGELTARIDALMRAERAALVDLLLHLAELDRRKLHVGLGYASFFEYCTRHLRLTEASAYRRTTGARLLAHFPVIATYLRDGRLNLTTLCSLRNVLTQQNHIARLEQALGRTENQVKRMVASLMPKHVPRDVISPVAPTATTAPGESAATIAPSATATASAPATPPPPSPDPCAAPGAIATTMTPPVRAQFVPLTETLTRIHMTVDESFMQKLAQVRSALSHKLPGASPAELLAECMRLTLEKHGRRKRGADKVRTAVAGASASVTKGRYVPAEVRAAVWKRDDGACAFAGAGGERCGSTHQVELHQITPFAMGGANTVENLALRCRIHNVHEAQEAFGSEVMDRFTNSTQ